MSVPRPDPDPALVLEHAPYVRALARELVFDRHLARDLEQDVLLAALANAPRDPRSIQGWLAAIVRNLASKAHRSRARRVEREARAARAEDAVPTPDQVLAREDLRRWLLEHLVALGEPVRAVMILRFAEDLPPREIARRLRIPVETVRTRVKRGLEELRARLDRDPRRGNGVWCLALVQGLKIGPPSLVGAGITLCLAALPGVLAVSTAKKALAAALVVALAAGVFLVSREVEPLHPPADARAAMPAPDTTKLSASEQSVSTTGAEGRSAVAAEPVARPAPRATDSSVLLELHWHDGTPAAGVVARMYCNAAEDFYVDTLDVRTGADGTHLCEHLPPGRVTAYLDRGPEGACEVAAGETATIELTIPRGFDFSGVVVEADGRPVAGAEILIDGMGSGWNAYSVDRSGSDGSFHIRSLQSGGLYWLSAHAPLHAPSPQVMVLGGSADVQGVRIAFDGTGAALAGLVFDPEGQPLAGAQVLVGREDSWEQMALGNGQQARKPAAQLARVDESGRFRVAGVPVGKVLVQARGKGCAPWKGEVETSEGASAELVIRMQHAVTLHGHARDAQGAPLKVSIQANGDFGFAQRFKKSAPDGSFVVTGLPAGEFVVKASADGHADAHTTLVGTPGAELEWNPVLGSGLAISGRLVAQGIDFSKWWMYCESEDWQKAPYAQSATPKADGSFEFAGCGAAKHRIRAHAPGASLYPVASFEAQPGPEPVLVPIDSAMLPSCRAQGRIVDESGQPVAGVQLNLVLKGANVTPLETVGADGRFDLGPTPPGEYQLIARAPGYAQASSAKVTLVANTSWDFGELHLVRGGFIAVHLVRPAAHASGHVGLEVLRAGTSATWIRVEDDRGHSDALEPGEYELRAWIENQRVEVPGAALRVLVRAGEESAVEIALP